MVVSSLSADVKEDIEIMRYISIDIETTGLEEERDQIIEIGIVEENTKEEKEIKELKRFHCYVENKRIEGNAYAIGMNAEKIKRISKREPGFNYLKPEEVVDSIKEWLKEIGYKENERIVIAGKNVGIFDLQFLKRLKGWEEELNIHHRVLDPGMMYLDIEDLVPPNLSECKVRAGLESEVSHTAIEDAIDVIKLIRYKLGIKF
jgi:oligoribonuclease